MKFTAPIMLSIVCLLACNPVFAAKVYKWVENGQVHYGTQPPMNIKAELINSQATTGTAPTTAPVTPPVASSSAKSSASPKADPVAALKDKDRCEAAQKNVETLKTYTHIKFQDTNGEYRYLTPEEQQQKLEEASKAAEESCE